METVDLNQLTARVKALLTSPKTEWPVIASEPATVASLYSGYIMILAAIPAVCTFVKLSIIGVGTSMFGSPLVADYRLGFSAGIGIMIVRYVLSLVVVYILGVIIDALAPTFGAQKDPMQALKTAAYSFTASWVAGVGILFPFLGTLIELAGAAYAIYLLYLGLQSVMKAPADKAGGYTAVTVIVAIVAGWVVSVITGGLMGVGTMGVHLAS